MDNLEEAQTNAMRARPSQARGKARVRTILLAALELFKERGYEAVSTNDIAERANVPIGSLYRYYPNKDAIVAALTQLYVEDVSDIFAGVGKHTMLKYLSWDEVLFMMVDGWVQYSRRNGPFTFLYIVRASPKLYADNAASRQELVRAFTKVLRKRCTGLTKRQAVICFGLSLAAFEMGANPEYRAVSDTLHHEAVSAAASYMLRICGSYEHHSGHILP